MKTIFKLQYVLLLSCLWFSFNTINLQAQCATWIDFTDEGVIPDGCGTVWTEDNQPIDLQIIAVNDFQYTCNSSQPDCTHTKNGQGLTLENSVLQLDVSFLRNLYKLHVDFLEEIEEGDVELRLFNDNTLLETVLPNSFGVIVFQNAIAMQQTTRLELFVCEGTIENFGVSYDCLGINQGGDNYCNMFDTMDVISLGGNFDENELLLSIGDGVLVYQEPIYDLFYSSSWWLGIDVRDNDIFGNPFPTGKNVRIHGSLRFDFSPLPDPVQKVQFAVEKPFFSPANYWHPINIRVNGEDLVIAQKIWDVTTVAPNVSLSVTGTAPQIVTLTGEIEELVIGAHNTHLSLFCYETGTPVQEEKDNCLFFEGVVEGDYEGITLMGNLPKIDFRDGDFLFAEDGVAVFAKQVSDSWPLTEIGRVEVSTGNPVDGPSSFGVQDFGTENFMTLDSVAVEFDFGGQTEQVTSVDINYSDIGTLALQVNNETFYEGSVNSMPAEIAEGVNLTVNYDEDALKGVLSLEGNIRRVLIGSSNLMWLDDVCFETTPYILPDNACFDFDDIYFTRFGSRSFGTDAYGGEVIYNYEGLPISLEGNQEVEGSTAGHLDFNVLEDGTGDVLVQDGGIGFDFSAIGKPLAQVSFDYGNTGTFNLNINSLPTIEVVNHQVVGTPPADFDIVIGQNVVYINGDVQKLIVSGENILLDNLCYTTNPIEGGVWPGDTNSDGIANNLDLLPIGVAYGSMGNPRINPTLTWIAQAADDWTDVFLDGVNYKHADCNGDGEILLDDLEGIIQNYGKIHAKNGSNNATPEDAPLYVELPDETLNEGDNLTAPIVLGTMDIPATDIYGIAFTVTFDSELVNPESIAVTFEDCWLGTVGENVITLSQPFGTDGEVDVAISRIDLTNQTGYGVIGTLSGIIDNIAGKKSIQQDLIVKITNVHAISADETPIPVFPTADTVIVTDIHDEILDASIEVFPIPAKNKVSLSVPDLQKVRSLQLFNTLGQMQKDWRKQEFAVENMLQLEVSQLESGMYFLMVDYDGVLVSRKVILE